MSALSAHIGCATDGVLMLDWNTENVSTTGTGGVRPLDFRETAFFLVLATATILSGAEVVQMLGEAFAEAPRGISYHLFFTAGGFLGLSPAGTVVFTVAFLFGLLTLLTLDEYRRYSGAFLLVVSLIGLLILPEFGLIQISWLDSPAPALVGFLAGLFFGGRGPGSSDAFHDVLETRGANSLLEFPGAIWWVYTLATLIALVSIFEGVLIYESPLLYRNGALSLRGTEFIGFDNDGLLIELTAAGVFLFCIGVYRNVTADRNVTLLGSSATGKTSTMAGLGKAVGQYTDGTYDLNAPLKNIRRELEEKNRTGATNPGVVFPLEMTFKHGRLLPRKVTVRVFDYAGTHIQDFSPVTGSGTATPNIEVASAVARYIHNESIDKDDSDYIMADEGIDPEEIAELEGMGTADQVVRLLQDVVFYSDGVGLLFPMDDFAEGAVEAGLEPDYVNVDRDEKGYINNAREHDPYLSTMRQIDNQYSDDKGLFIVATKADIVRGYCDLALGVDPESDWEAFGNTIAEECIDTAMPDETDEVIPIHFDVADDEESGTGEEVTLNTTAPDGKYTLRGAGRMLDRIGGSQISDLLPGGRR